MKIKLANYISKLLVQNGITQSFSVVGGGSMHLNNAFGLEKGINTLYQHHEQACAMAAEAYARIYNRPALLCVTSGPGGTNAITGVLGAWLDSLPMFVVSGQVRYDNTKAWSGVKVRAIGDQEFEIVQSISCMTKYSEMLIDPMRVRYVVEKCLYLCQTGRPGPVWIDIPVNIQGMMIEEDDLIGFDVEKYQCGESGWAQENEHILDRDRETVNREAVIPHVTEDQVEFVINKIRSSQRPVFYTGNGIRIAGAESIFLKVCERLNIPVVVGWNGEDVISEESELYVGRPGGRGDRPGNLAVQNADLIFSVGSRLNIRQVGYNYKTWAREAYVIVNDIDSEELKKPTVHCDYPIHADAKELLEKIYHYLETHNIQKVFGGGKGIKDLSWLDTCKLYRDRYPVIQKNYLDKNASPANVYNLINELSSQASENQVTVVGNGSACVAGGQAYRIKRGTRFISQDGVASMGYDLPAAIGACVAIHSRDYEETLKNARKNPFWKGVDEVYPDYQNHDIILLTGDGSIQMNLQELQTIIHHKMPIKIFVINNQGYQSIRQTQTNFFGKPLVGVGTDSGRDGVCDLSFPDMGKIAKAYGFPYFKICNNAEMKGGIHNVLQQNGPVICEVFVTTEQGFRPTSAPKELPDGSIVNPPLEELFPFLSDEEMDEIMIVKRI